MKMVIPRTRNSKKEMYVLPWNLRIVYICSVCLLVSEFPQTKLAFNAEWKYKKLASVAHGGGGGTWVTFCWVFAAGL